MRLKLEVEQWRLNHNNRQRLGNLYTLKYNISQIIPVEIIIYHFQTTAVAESMEFNIIY